MFSPGYGRAGVKVGGPGGVGVIVAASVLDGVGVIVGVNVGRRVLVGVGVNVMVGVSVIVGVWVLVRSLFNEAARSGANIRGYALIITSSVMTKIARIAKLVSRKRFLVCWSVVCFIFDGIYIA